VRKAHAWCGVFDFFEAEPVKRQHLRTVCPEGGYHDVTDRFDRKNNRGSPEETAAAK